MAKVSAEKLTKEFTENLLEKIGLEAKIRTSEKDNLIEVIVEGENLGALIGYHGETLESLQLLLALMLNRTFKEEDWKRVSVDIGSWREERKATLKSMVEKAIEEIKASDSSRVSLPPMSAAQRREVHIIVSEQFNDYQTQSEGEDPYRKVFLVKNN